MLKGKNIYLRTFKDSDLNEYIDLDNDISNRGEYYPLMIGSEVSIRNWYNGSGLWDDDFGRMLIFDYEHKMLGHISYFKTTLYFEALEVGYILFDESKRGKGVMTEAVQLFTDYLFRSKKITRLEIRCNEKNVGSKRVAEKCGFIFEGINRGFMRKAGEVIDVELYSKTINDWLK